MKNRSMIEYQMNLLHSIFKSQTKEAQELLKQLDPSYEEQLFEVKEQYQEYGQIKRNNEMENIQYVLPSIDAPEVESLKKQKAKGSLIKPAEKPGKLLEKSKRSNLKQKFLEQMQKNADQKALEFVNKLNQDRKNKEMRFLKARQRVYQTTNTNRETSSRADTVIQQLKPKPIQKPYNSVFKSKSVNQKNFKAEITNKIQNKSNKTWLQLAIREIIFEIANNIVRQSYKKEAGGPVKLDLSKHRYFKSKFRMQIEQKQKQIRVRRYQSLNYKQCSTAEINNQKKKISENKQVLNNMDETQKQVISDRNQNYEDSNNCQQSQDNIEDSQQALKIQVDNKEEELL